MKITCRRLLALWGLLAFICSSADVAGAQMAPLGGSFDVSSATGLLSPEVAALGSGGFAVVWWKNGLKWRLYDSSGGATSPDPGSSSFGVEIAYVAPYGESGFASVVDGSAGFLEPDCVIARRVVGGVAEQDGLQVCEERLSFSRVAAFPDGGLVLGWIGGEQEAEVRARIIASDNSPGGTFRVSAASDGTIRRSLSDIGAWQDGFVMVWRDQPPGNISASLMGRRYRRSGEALGGPFSISGDIDPFNSYPIEGRVAVNRGGRSVVVWSERSQSAANTRKVRARIYDPAGDSLGPAFDLYRPAAGESAFKPSVAIDSAGNFVVVWRGSNCSDPYHGSRLKGQLFDRHGEPRGPAVEIGEGIGSPTVALTDQGLVFATYRGEDLIQGRFFDAGTDVSCMPDESTLCLNDGRFQVRVDWEKPNGETGIGRVVPAMSADTGIFWFFNGANWELLVKVLNGCERTGHYWVFSAATTNVHYELTVTDMLTQQQRTYVNSQGIAAAAVTDTAAFATCP